MRRWIHSPECREICSRHGFFPARFDYMSPIPHVERLRPEVFDRVFATAGIELDAPVQLGRLAPLAARHGVEPGFPTGGRGPLGFHLEQERFPNADAGIAYLLLRHFRPRRVVEIGSGYSSLLIAEVGLRNREEGYPLEHTVVDPFLATALVAEALGEMQCLRLPAQEAPGELFDTLADGDVLFIDSSHVVKLGSDVQYLVLEVLPRLRPGVLVHFHDVYLPYEYPRSWTEGGYFYNESYFVHAFLAFSSAFEVVVAGHFLDRVAPRQLRDLFPRTLGASSLWLRRVRAEAGRLTQWFGLDH